MFVAILTCGAMMLTSCSTEDNTIGEPEPRATGEVVLPQFDLN